LGVLIGVSELMDTTLNFPFCDTIEPSSK